MKKFIQLLALTVMFATMSVTIDKDKEKQKSETTRPVIGNEPCSHCQPVD